MAGEEGEKPDKKEKKRTTIDDWMVRISFAEAGGPGKGFTAPRAHILTEPKAPRGRDRWGGARACATGAKTLTLCP